MPDFGIGETLAALGLGGEGVLGGLGSLLGFGGEAAAAAAPEIAGGVAAAGAPLDLLAGGAAAGTAGLGAVGDVFAPAALGAATGGLGFGGSGLGGAIGTDAASLGGLSSILGGADAALPSASTLTSGTGGGISTGGIGSDAVAAPNAIQPSALTAGTTAAPAAASPVAPVGGAAGAGPTDLTSAGAKTGGSFLDKLTPSALAGSAVDQVSKNPLGIALGLGGLGANLLGGNKQPTGQPQLASIAPQETAAGLQNQQYLTTGTLPPGMQASVAQATKDAKQAIISNYATRGLPTDPTKNSALAEELANVDQTAIKTTATLGQQLLTSGLSQTQLGEQTYQSLVGIDQTEQSQIQQAIANFAKSLGGGGINLQLAK